MANGFEGRAGWLMRMLRKEQQAKPRLALLDRIALAPRQSLALVEAEGRRILVATSPEGGPVFYPLDENHQANNRSEKHAPGPVRAAARRSGVSW
jgi:flagellar biogenesis protein FliO